MSTTLTYAAVSCVLGSLGLLAALFVALGLRSLARERRRPEAWEPARARLGARWERVSGRPALAFDVRGLRGTARIQSNRGAGSSTQVEVITGPAPAPGHPLDKVVTETLPGPPGWTLRRQPHRVWASRSGTVLDAAELLRVVDAVVAAIAPR